MKRNQQFTPGEFNRSINYQSRAQREEEIKVEKNKAIIILRCMEIIKGKWNFLSGSNFSSFVRGAEFSEGTSAV